MLTIGKVKFVASLFMRKSGCCVLFITLSLENTVEWREKYVVGWSCMSVSWLH